MCLQIFPTAPAWKRGTCTGLPIARAVHLCSECSNPVPSGQKPLTMHAWLNWQRLAIFFFSEQISPQLGQRLGFNSQTLPWPGA